jgi:hypothetical protein
MVMLPMTAAAAAAAPTDAAALHFAALPCPALPCAALTLQGTRSSSCQVVRGDLPGVIKRLGLQEAGATRTRTSAMWDPLGLKPAGTQKRLLQHNLCTC